MPPRVVVPAVLVALAGLLAGCAAAPPAAPRSSPPADPSRSAAPRPPVSPSPSPSPTFDRAARSIDDPASIWVVVNRRRPLQPQNYEPPDLVEVPVTHTWVPLLRREASDAVGALFRAARDEAGLALASNSAYRSYTTQKGLYTPGDPTTAPPGTSEHQTGLAIDIGAASGKCSLDPCFTGTPEGRWLAANAWRFGFLLRFPADKAGVTGYPFEPWHFRYIGTDLAAELHGTGVTTLEEFFGLPPAPAP